MLIKVSGLCSPENIADVVKLGVDMAGFVFSKGDPRRVGMIPSLAGIIPDYADRRMLSEGFFPKRVGIFKDDMPQSIVTAVYNYRLDYVQLDGDESPVMIDNLRRSLVPDIVSGISIIKKVSMSATDTFGESARFSGYADMLLFDTDDMQQADISVFESYSGNLPFLIGGRMVACGAGQFRNMRNPMFAGVDLDNGFEVSPGIKDMEKLRSYIASLKA